MKGSDTHSLFSQKERFTLIVLGGLAFLFGVIGYHQHLSAIKQAATFSDLAYLSVNLFFMQFTEKGPLPISLDIARWLAPATLSYTLIKTAMGLMTSRLQKLKFRHLKDHAVIVGVDEHSAQVALSFREKGLVTLAVDKNEQNKYWGHLRKNGVFTFVVNPSDQSLLQAVNIKQAKYLFVATQSDATNLKVTYDTHHIKQSSSSKSLLETVCQIHNRSLRYALYNRPLFTTNHPNHNTRLVDYNAIAARWLLNEYGPHKLIDSFATASSLKIVILGSDKIYIDLIIKLASLGLYQSAEHLHVALIHKDALSLRKLLVSQASAVNELITFEAIEVDGYEDLSYAARVQNICPDLIYLCEQQTDQKVLAIQQLIDNSFQGQIVVCELENQSTFKWLEDEFKHQQNIKFAKINTATCDYNNVFENKLDALAKAIHDDYVHQQLANGDSPSQNSSLVDWSALPEILKDANRNQADHVLIKCQYLTNSSSPSVEEVQSALTQDKKLVLAQMEHRRWLAEKKLAGWRYTEGSKNPAKKLSPSLIEWDALSEAEKQKDIATIDQLPELIKLMY
ncbi:NAD-binding protein [Paraglaciecola aquimarina]|uniref:NAD-binding protein n=1 Tax=Paraglaciecola algarum TaxID=3050085 RepID=A0ABS9D3U3_9ALTE|nr:RyR domain-containing protein [Paraglaciecola sp. G1-23]MCF2947556.1 NAD-binding protein [Paraglaciecola sp. G1-23]